MSPFALAALFVSLALVALGVIAYSALRLWLDRTKAHASVVDRVDGALSKAEAEALERDVKVKQLREDVDFLRLRAGL